LITFDIAERRWTDGQPGAVDRDGGDGSGDRRQTRGAGAHQRRSARTQSFAPQVGTEKVTRKAACRLLGKYSDEAARLAEETQAMFREADEWAVR
jgi:hypothetical protein